jgi:TolA-binding protein
VKKQIILVTMLTILNSCTFVQRFENLENQIENLQQELKETNKDLDFLAKKVRSLQSATEELAKNLRQNLKLLEDLDVAPVTSSPPQGIPENFLIEDRQKASLEGLRTKASIYTFLNKITTGDFVNAITLAEELRKSSPVAQEIANFWLIDCFLRVNELRKALDASIFFIQNYKAHPRLPYVLLRQASIFTSLNDKKAAEVTLRKLINDYPKSQEAEIARKLLNVKN